MAPALPRPRQVTIAGWMIMVGSVSVVLLVFQQIAGLQTVDTRDALERVAGQPPFDAMDLDVDEMLRVVRVLAMVAAACATATAILGWHALQRSRSARVALSILAVPLFLTGMGSGGILSSIVAAAVVLLWLQPARDWFDGTWSPEADERRTPTAERRPPGSVGSAPAPSAPSAPLPAPDAPAPPQAPPPYAGWPPPQQAWPPAGPPAPYQGAPHPGPHAGPQPGPAPYRAGTAAARPPAVVAAVVITWVCSVLLGGLFVVGAGWLIARPEALMDEMTKQNPELVRDGTVTVDLLRGMLVAVIGLVVVWVLAACALAFFVLRRASWARALLLVSTGVAGLALLLCTLANVAMVVPLAATAAVFALLLRSDVGAWFRAPR